VSPKANTSSRQGWHGLARWRGGGVGMVHRPGSTRTSERMGCPCNARPTGRIRRSSAERIEWCVLPVDAGWRWWHRQWRQGVGCASGATCDPGDWSMERPLPLADDLSRRSPFRAPNEGCNSVHNLASYGRQPPVGMLVRTSVAARSMVRMGPVLKVAPQGGVGSAPGSSRGGVQERPTTPRPSRRCRAVASRWSAAEAKPVQATARSRWCGAGRGVRHGVAAIRSRRAKATSRCRRAVGCWLARRD